jgi:hypothetical protein
MSNFNQRFVTIVGVFTIIGAIAAVLSIPESRALSRDSVTTQSGVVGQETPFVPMVEPPSVNVLTVELDARRPGWTNTGIEVNRGDILDIEVSGNVVFDPEIRAVGPGGTDWKANIVGHPNEFLLPNENLAAVIGRINDRVFLIGSRSQVIAQADGPLWLAINERWITGAWDDNRGTFQVSVRRERP